MRRIVILLLLVGLSLSTVAQNNRIFVSDKPINKGNFVFNFGYEHQPSNGLQSDASKLCFGVGYGFLDWCVAGVYADYGRDFMANVGISIGDYWCQYHSNYLSYGIHTELHPIAPLWPGFFFFDVYALFRVGMHHFVCDIVSEENYNPYQGYLINMLANTTSPYVSCGYGFAINPSKYFGLFYEGSITSLKYRGQDRFYLFNRFGINLRINGPKKKAKDK